MFFRFIRHRSRRLRWSYALGTVRVALERAGTLVERPNDPVADSQVVLDEVDLAATRGAHLPEVDLLRIGDFDEALTNFQLDEG